MQPAPLRLLKLHLQALHATCARLNAALASTKCSSDNFRYEERLLTSLRLHALMAARPGAQSAPLSAPAELSSVALRPFDYW